MMLKERIHEIVGWFDGVYRSPDGWPWYEIDGDQGHNLSDRTLIVEIGDYLPFFLSAGEEDFVIREIQSLRSVFKEQTPMFNQPIMRRNKGLQLKLPGLGLMRYTDMLDYSEILYGLLECSDIADCPVWSELACEIGEQVVKLFLKKNYLSSWSWKDHKVPLTEPLSGMFIEIFCELKSCRSEVNFLAVAEDMGRFWSQNVFFRQYGVFPSVVVTSKLLKKVPQIQPATRRAVLVKHNLAMLWGLKSLYLHTGKVYWLDCVKHWLEGAKQHFLLPEGIYSHVAFGFPWSSPNGQYPVLSTNFAMIDLLCDLHYETEESSYLQEAMTAGDWWLDRQSSQTGLFPDDVSKNISYLDGNTDFIVAYLKLYEISGEDKYRQAALKCLKGVIKYHHCPYGYYTNVHLNNGTPLNARVETRFVSLFMKALLLIESGASIYGPDGWLDRLKDR